MTLLAAPSTTVHLSSSSIMVLVGLTVGLLVVVIGGILFARKFLPGETKPTPAADWAAPEPTTDNASAFMTASMQGVIEKLRAQEKELARLHALAQERVKESERFNEEVTRNMPTGLLLVNATGAIGSANKAAEEALGMRSLRYRSYKELLGADSTLARMLETCLHTGATFQREEVEHLTSMGEARRLGVTISPVFRHVRTVSKAPASSQALGTATTTESRPTGALCLMSDLTELTALQKQIRWK